MSLNVCRSQTSLLLAQCIRFIIRVSSQVSSGLPTLNSRGWRVRAAQGRNAAGTNKLAFVGERAVRASTRSGEVALQVINNSWCSEEARRDRLRRLVRGKQVATRDCQQGGGVVPTKCRPSSVGAAESEARSDGPFPSAIGSRLPWQGIGVVWDRWQGGVEEVELGLRLLLVQG